MMINCKVLLYALLFILAVLFLSIYFKRKQRTYSPVLKQQIVDLTDTTLEHLQRAKQASDPLVRLQEASYAYAVWNSVQKLTTPEDLPSLVATDTDQITKQVKAEMLQAIRQFQ